MGIASKNIIDCRIEECNVKSTPISTKITSNDYLEFDDYTIMQNIM